MARSCGLTGVALLPFRGVGAIGCSTAHEDCASIALGTPMADVPVFAPTIPTPYCRALSGPMGAEELALRCCASEAPSDGGVIGTCGGCPPD